MAFLDWFKKKDETLKFCRDCKYILDDKVPKCLHSSSVVTNIDYVNGGSNSYGYNCYDMRTFESYCGKKAKYFEPKENGA